MTPGDNLLSIALSLITPQEIIYRKNGVRALNAARQWVTTFGEPFYLMASVQRVPRKKYVQYGLEFQKNYISVYASVDMIDLERDTTGDQLVYGGRTYQLESQGTWFLQDGWALCQAVDIGPAMFAVPEVPPAPVP